MDNETSHLEKFLKRTTLIKYSKANHEKQSFTELSQLSMQEQSNGIKWLNTYGDKFFEEFAFVIEQNNLDNFLSKLFKQKHTNKVIELDNVLFISVNVLRTDKLPLYAEQMMFIIKDDFLWSIQQKKGDYFEAIRERLLHNKGIVREKKADYLLFSIIEAIIENYQTTFQKLADTNDELFKMSKIEPTPEYINLVEERRQELFKLKKVMKSLRDTITKLEKITVISINFKYFNELKEQSNNLLLDIDFELQELDSKINLIFNIQGQRLNEVMKTLTIFSVIFIPLTFLAGIYGMNFSYMPELAFKGGYFILLGVMLLITILIIWYFKRRKWF